MIFEDISQERWKRVRMIFIIMAGFGLILLSGAIGSVVINPPLPSVLSQRHHQEISQEVKTALLQADSTRAQNRPAKTPTRSRPLVTSSTSTPFALRDHPLFSAFVNQDTPDSVQSLSDHADLVDIVFPDWFSVTSSTCAISTTINPVVSALAHDHHILLLPRISNVDATGWKSEEFGKLLKDPETTHCLVEKLATAITTNQADGINVDIEDLDPSSREPFLDFLEELTTAFHAAHKFVTVDMPVNDPAFDHEYIGTIADGVVVMAYDEHYVGGSAGPIASEDWYQDVLDQSLAEIPREKILMGIANYGYDWTVNTTTPAMSMGFSDVMALAAEYEAQPEMNTSSRNMAFAYLDDDGHNHAVWFLNGITAWNETERATTAHTAGTALWRLGTEDPLLWRFVRRPTTTAESFVSSSPLRTITYTSQGEVFGVRTIAHAGSLDLTTDENGLVDYAEYSSLPRGYVLERVGRSFPPRTISLTFDDGPDPVWTPKIMDVLTANHVPATFFVVGSQAENYPDLLKKIHDNGFLIGNHTYTHPDISKISSNRLELEVNQTQRVIEAEYGTRTILFRPPYDTDSAPSTLAEIQPIGTLSSLGYVVVGANIDSSDWEKPGVDTIISNIKNGLQNTDNHIIVMHDAGGDRSQTVAALAKLIPELRQAGYTFIGLPAALNIPTSTLNPPLDPSESQLVFSTKAITLIRHWGWSIISWLFFITTGLSLVRLLFLGWFALRSRRHTTPLPKREANDEIISVIIPAYNEEKTLEKTLATLERSTYPHLDIVVVDDGSSDATKTVAENFARRANNVRVIVKPNGGKASALNVGIASAHGEIVVIIDADTIVYPETISNLAKAFLVPGVDAACGNVEVGNVHNLLTSFQALEYIVTQNFDRRAFDELNCISVVPGATGAWRKTKLLELGGFSHDTLTEDADITLRLLRSGGKIVYVTEARSKTEAPETMRELAKQRFRWSYGTFQCFYKHRDALFAGTLGWIALPNMFFFQVLFPLLSPLGDLVFLLSIWRGDFGAIAIGYFLFLTMDVCSALLGFALEKRGDKKLLLLTLIQRFFYRQFMYVVTYRTIVAVLRGRRHGWNKLTRSGRVETMGHTE